MGGSRLPPLLIESLSLDEHRVAERQAGFRLEPMNRRQPLVIAHRGASGYAPENTLEAFELAVALGADGVELDVGLSADGQPVVIHDHRVDRTTNGTGRVASLTTLELGKLDAGTRFKNRFKKSIPAHRNLINKPGSARDSIPARLHLGVPTLEETLALLAGAGLARIYVELKGTPSTRPALLTSSLLIIRRSSVERRVTLLSFDQKLLAAAKKMQPAIRVAATIHVAGGLIPTARMIARSAVRVGATEVALHHALVTRRRVAALHERGLDVSAWTANGKSTMRRLIDCGVESIMTDYPDRLEDIIDSAVT